MSTHYTRPDAGAARAPFPIVSRDVTRYRSAAEICAAINAAAADAPEFSDACYAPGAADWHGPTRGASFAHFLYCIDGARGSYSVPNIRAALLNLARKVNMIRAAFDGKPRRAPTAKRAPTSAPHVAARGLWADGEKREAIELAQNHGSVFFGAAGLGKPGIPYMQTETIELSGHSFTIGRSIQTGRVLVLHTKTALSVSGASHRDGFKTHGAALDWIETESACAAWIEKLETAAHDRPEFSQAEARAFYFEDETGETAPDAQPEPAPVSTAPVDSPEPVTTAPDAPMDPAAVDRAPDAPIEPAPVESWPALAPMMRPVEHVARLPFFARLAIERLDCESDLRTGAKLDEMLQAYAAQYRETCDDDTRQSAHAIASRRFWNFRPDDAPIAPAAIVPAADPAPVCEPVESPALQATRAHQWMTHAARRVYWVHCETARFSRELGPLPFGSMFRRPRSPGFMPDFLAPEIRAHRAAVAAAVRADRAAKRAPDYPPAMGFPPEWIDPVAFTESDWPVDADPPVPPVPPAAPGGWIRPATGMLSEAEARAWPSAEPVESAPTPGYAFPADALPATHSDAAPVDVDTMRAQLCAVDDAILAAAPRKFSNGQYGGDIEAAARSRSVPAELKRRRKTLRAMISAARDAAADPAPVPGDSEPVPGKSDLHARIIDSTRRRILANPSGTAAGFDCERERLERAIANCGDDMPGVMSANTRALETLRAEFCTDPAPVNSPAPVDPDEAQPGETGGAWFERIRRENREKRARIDALADVVAAGSGSIGFTHPSDPARYGIAGPDMSGRGAFRFTYFDAVGPIGDAIRPSLADAIAAGIEYGFTVDAAPLEWPENPAPAPVPVPVPGKFETFASLSDVDLRRYIEGCHIARQFGIDFEHAAQELNDRKERGTWSNPGAPVATHSAPIAEPVALATHSAPVDDGGFSRRVDTAAAYISGGRRTSRTFDSCFEMWDGDAVAVALLRRAEKRPGTRLAANLSRYLARHHVEAAADRQPTGLSLAEWSRALIKAREPLPETAPVPADTLPADTAPTYVDVFADGFGFYCYSLRDGSKWTGRPSFEAAAAELAGMGMQARAAGLNPPVPADTAPDDDTTPAPLDGLDVIETADAETLAEFDRLSRAPGVSQPASDARPIPSGPVLRIPAGDLRARIPARFAPAYLLTA